MESEQEKVDSGEKTTEEDQKSVSLYFVSFLSERKDPVHINVLRGYVSSPDTPAFVRFYVQKHCRREKLLFFFKKRKNYFIVDENCCVSLKKPENVDKLFYDERNRCERHRRAWINARDIRKLVSENFVRCVACDVQVLQGKGELHQRAKCSKCAWKSDFPCAQSKKKSEPRRENVLKYFIERLRASKSICSHTLAYKKLPDYVANYLKKEYPRKLHKFFLDNCEIFSVCEDGRVLLKGDDGWENTSLDENQLNALKMLVSELKIQGGEAPLSLIRERLSKAPGEIRSTCYTDSKHLFRNFILNHPNLFKVDGQNVYLMQEYSLWLQVFDEEIQYDTNSYCSLDAEWGSSRSEDLLSIDDFEDKELVNAEDSCSFTSNSEGYQPPLSSTSKYAHIEGALCDSKKKRIHINQKNYKRQKATKVKRENRTAIIRENAPGVGMILLEEASSGETLTSSLEKGNFILQQLRQCGFFNVYHDSFELPLLLRSRICRLLWSLDLLCLERMESDQLADSMAVEYFANEIAQSPSRSLSISVLQGKVGNATPEVLAYINVQYHGQKLEEFFLDHEEFKVTDSVIVSLKSRTEEMSDIKRKPKEVYYGKTFVHVYCTVFKTLVKTIVYLSFNQEATLKHVSNIMNSLTHEEKVVIRSFSGRNTTEKLVNYFKFFDGIFESDGEAVSVSNSCDVCLQFVIEAALLGRVIFKLSHHDVCADACEKLTTELMTMTLLSLPVEVRELCQILDITGKLHEKLLSQSCCILSCYFNVMMNKVDVLQLKSTLEDIKTEMAILLYALVIIGTCLPYSSIPDLLVALLEKSPTLMIYCSPGALIELFKSELLTCSGGKVSCKNVTSLSYVGFGDSASRCLLALQREINMGGGSLNYAEFDACIVLQHYEAWFERLDIVCLLQEKYNFSLDSLVDLFDRFVVAETDVKQTDCNHESSNCVAFKEDAFCTTEDEQPSSACLENSQHILARDQCLVKSEIEPNNESNDTNCSDRLKKVTDFDCSDRLEKFIDHDCSDRLEKFADFDYSDRQEAFTNFDACETLGSVLEETSTRSKLESEDQKNDGGCSEICLNTEQCQNSSPSSISDVKSFFGQVIVITKSFCIVEVCCEENKWVYCTEDTFHCSKHQVCMDSIASLSLEEQVVCSVLGNSNDSMWTALNVTNLPRDAKIGERISPETFNAEVQAFYSTITTETQTDLSGPVLFTNFLP